MSRCPPLNADFEATVLAAELPRHVHAGYMRYRAFEPLGQGGKAEVFRCIDANLGREVALKVLHQRLADVPLEHRLLVREARITAALQHAAIPAVHDLGRDPQGRPYFAMALKTGPTLHDVLGGLRQRDPVTARRYALDDLLGVLIHAAAALEYAHDRNVVHCDLKPENIVLDGDAVSLLDWGLALIDDYPPGREPNPALCDRGCQGSALYMAPEQVARDPWIGPAADVFGLGVLLYECLTLDTPHRGADSAATLHNVLHREPLPPRTAAPDRGIPRALEDVCLRALEKSPDDRFDSMAEFRAVLQECRLDLIVEFGRNDADVGPRLADFPAAWDDAIDADRATQCYSLEDAAT